LCDPVIGNKGRHTFAPLEPSNASQETMMDLATKTVLQTLVHTIVSHSDAAMARAIETSLFKAADDLANENYDLEAHKVRSVAEAAIVAQDNGRA
jgi:hypothetical protein